MEQALEPHVDLKDLEGLERRSSPGILILPRDDPQTKSVTSCCAICLEHYRVGEKIAWATNTECNHCFHIDCITPFFLSKKVSNIKDDARNPCPLCRKPFLIVQKKSLPEKEDATKEQKLRWTRRRRPRGEHVVLITIQSSQAEPISSYCISKSEVFRRRSWEDPLTLYRYSFSIWQIKVFKRYLWPHVRIRNFFLLSGATSTGRSIEFMHASSAWQILTEMRRLVTILPSKDRSRLLLVASVSLL